MNLNNNNINLEKNLREVNNYDYKSFFQKSKDLICRFLPDTTLIDVNEGYCNYFNKTKKELIGKKFIDFIPQKSKEETLNYLKSFSKLNYKQSYIHTVKKDNDEEFWQEWNDYAFFNEMGEIKEFLSIGRDISVQKDMELKLIQNYELLNTLVESILDVIIILKSDYSIKFMNDAACKLFQISKKEAMSKKCYHLLGKKNVCEVCATKKAIKEKKIVSIEKYMPDFDLCIDFRSNPVFDQNGKLLFIVEHLRDISKQKKLEQKQKQIIQEQNFILKNVKIHKWYFSDIYTYGEVNEVHANFFGYKENEIKNKSLFDIYEFKEAEICAKENKMAFTEKKVIQKERWIENKRGEKRLISFTKTPEITDNNTVKYLICYGIDITEKRRREEEAKYLYSYDALTDLYNRQYIKKELKKIDKESNLPLSIIVSDINGLRLINDAFGYYVGNQLLKKTAKFIKKICEPKDTIARWGEDEFIIFLPKKGLSEAEKIIDKINLFCEKEKIKNFNISMSLGCASKNKRSEKIFNVIKQAEEMMYNSKLSQANSSRRDVVRSLLEVLGEKSEETEEHSKRIWQMSLLLGRKMALSEEELNKLLLLANLHDIGKIAVPKKILSKKEDLNSTEWEIIKKHPETGYRIAKSVDCFSHIAKEILFHHERWDGQGYPQGLKGNEILLLARIISIIDAYDVMTNERKYNKVKTKKEAIVELKKNSGTQFDPTLVKKFIYVINNNDR